MLTFVNRYCYSYQQLITQIPTSEQSYPVPQGQTWKPQASMAICQQKRQFCRLFRSELP